MISHGHQPNPGGTRLDPPTTGSGVRPRRGSCPACERASLDNHDLECTRGPGCVERPAPIDLARAYESAVREARAASHSQRLDTAVQRAMNSLVAAFEAQVDLSRDRDRRIAELTVRVDRLAGVTFGDP